MCPRGFRRGVKFSRVQRLIGNGYLDALNVRQMSRVTFSSSCHRVSEQLRRIVRFVDVLRKRSSFPDRCFFSIHPSLGQVHIRKLCVSRSRLFSLHHSLRAVHSIMHFLHRASSRRSRRTRSPCPTLCRLTNRIVIFPVLVTHVGSVLSGFNGIGSGTSPRLLHVHHRLTTAAKDVSQDLGSVLHATRTRKCIRGSIAPAVHSKQLIVPITPNVGEGVQKVIRSRSTAKGAIFVRPTRIIRTGGHVHRLRNRRHERVVHVLASFSSIMHPRMPTLLRSCRFLTRISFVHTGTL